MKSQEISIASALIPFLPFQKRNPFQSILEMQGHHCEFLLFSYLRYVSICEEGFSTAKILKQFS